MYAIRESDDNNSTILDNTDIGIQHISIALDDRCSEEKGYINTPNSRDVKKQNSCNIPY